MTEPSPQPQNPRVPPLPSAAPAPASGSGKGCWIAIAFFAVFVLILAVGTVLLFTSFMKSLSGAEAQQPDGSVLEVSFLTPLAEAPPVVDLSPLFGGSPLSVWDVRRALTAAIEDPEIAAIRLDLGFSSIGWATAEEIVALLDQFRATGRPIFASVATDQLGDLDYFLATAADRIYLAPAAASMINGLVSQPQFYRGTLDKLAIEPQVIMYKEYKSAGEAYANYEMSPFMREAIEAVLETTHETLVRRVLARREISEEQFRQLLDRGMSGSQDLLELGLVDHIGYADELQDALAREAEVARYEGITLANYLEVLGKDRPRSRDRVAVVFGEGTIIAQEVENPLPFFGAIFSGPVVAQNLRDAVKDPNVKAIVFRVNSPGGSPVGSDIVRREVELAQKAGKPVVVSMADVAGSGGYWVAMGADRIVAHPTTITGSIGVVFSKLNLEPFFEKYGTTTATVKTAENADLFAAGSWDAEDRDAIETWMDQVYDDFTTGVAEGRELSLDEVREIARGRIWSGEDALQRGLVDELGGYDRALALARELAGLEEGASTVIYPRPRTLYQQLMEGGFTEMRAANLPELLTLQRWVLEMAAPRVQAVVPRIEPR